MQEQSFDFELINDRIYRVLAENKQIQKIAVIMMFALFLVGVGLLIFSFWIGNKVVAGFGMGAAAILEGMIYWPLNKLLKLYKLNIALGILPIQIRYMAPDMAADYIRALISNFLE